MHRQTRPNDAAHWYMGELGARIVAVSGRPEDRFNLGKLILQGLKDAPDFVVQIDGSTGESETCASVLERSIKCATAFRALGLAQGDVIVLMAPNHIDLAIPLYAAMYLGVIVAAVDRTLTISELQHTFSIDKPKLIFCQSEKTSDIQIALKEMGMDGEIITFDREDSFCCFSDFLEKHADGCAVEEFLPADFDPEDAIALLIATSGTTGLPKSAAGTHKNFAFSGAYWWATFKHFPTPSRMALVGSPLQWLTALINFIFAPIMKYTRLQSTLPLTRDHAFHLINTYKPTYAIFSPTLMTTLMQPPDRNECDFTCFETIHLGGSAVPPELIDEIKSVTPNTEVCDIYGMSEITGIAFHPGFVSGSSGTPMGGFQYRLIDVTTGEDMTQPNQQGELWIKGPGIFKEYYNNPEATDETFAEARWFKTGDIFYRDGNWNFFFVERFKLLLKYKSHHISPVEVENVIRQHPGVLDVAVTGIPDPECGDLAVACVVRKPGSDGDVEAQEIKDLVNETLTDSKQLRGGVIFVEAIPMTASTKVHRRRLKELALQLERE